MKPVTQPETKVEHNEKCPDEQLTKPQTKVPCKEHDEQLPKKDHFPEEVNEWQLQEALEEQSINKLMIDQDILDDALSEEDSDMQEKSEDDLET